MSFENWDGRTAHLEDYLPKVEKKNNIKIDGKNFFDQPIDNGAKTW